MSKTTEPTHHLHDDQGIQPEKNEASRFENGKISISSSNGDDEGREKEVVMTALLLDAPILDQYFYESFLIPHIWNWFITLIRTHDHSSPHHHRQQHMQRMMRVWKECILPWMLPMVTFLWMRGQTPAVRLLGLQFQKVQQRRRRRQKFHIFRNDDHIQDSSHYCSHFLSSSSSSSILPNRWELLPYAMIRFVLPALYHSWRVIWMEKIQQQQQSNATTTSSSFESNHDNNHPDNRDTFRSSQNHNQTARNPTQRRRDRPDEEGEEELQRRARQRRLALAMAWINFVDRRWIPIWNILGWLQCWFGNISNTSDLAMVLLGWTYYNHHRHERHHTTTNTTTPPAQLLFVDYAHRRWLWEEAWQTGHLFFSGLSLVRRIWGPILYDRVFVPLYTRYRWWLTQQQQQLRMLSTTHWFLPPFLFHHPNNRSNNHNIHITKFLCPVCGESPTNATFAQPCGHVYCYACFYKHHHHKNNNSNSRAKSADLGRCWECGNQITHAKDVFSQLE
jgi:hypothetical protein